MGSEHPDCATAMAMHRSQLQPCQYTIQRSLRALQCIGLCQSCYVRARAASSRKDPKHNSWGNTEGAGLLHTPWGRAEIAKGLPALPDEAAGAALHRQLQSPRQRGEVTMQQADQGEGHNSYTVLPPRHCMPCNMGHSQPCNLHGGGAAPRIHIVRLAPSQRKVSALGGDSPLPCCRSTTQPQHEAVEGILVSAHMRSSVSGLQGMWHGFQGRPGTCKALPQQPGRGGTEPNQELRKLRSRCHASAMSHAEPDQALAHSPVQAHHLLSALALPRRRSGAGLSACPNATCSEQNASALPLQPPKCISAAQQAVHMTHPPSPSQRTPDPKSHLHSLSQQASYP